MPETLEKLRPDRDLQCYFFQPTAVAAISQASPSGFTISGCWRQQFDWAVVEWNRDNVFEHPAFRYLPDGDLNGLVLTYEETRTNCVPIDSDLFPAVDWPYLRIWAGDNGDEKIYYVALKEHATSVEGSYASASAEFTLSGAAVPGDYIGLAYVDLHYTYQIASGDTLESALQVIVDGINAAWSPLLSATRIGRTIRAQMRDAATGANGNRFALYSYATGAAVWDSPGKTFSGGTSPSKWRVTLDFSSLQGRLRDAAGVLGPLQTIPTHKIRKMRWTYAADLQPGAFTRTEFSVEISNWTVTGANRGYKVAGPTSRRIEDNDASVAYSGNWSVARGNFSGGSIQLTQSPGDSVSVSYAATAAHTLYLGTRYTNTGALAAIAVDGAPAAMVNLHVPAEDVLIRWRIGDYGPGEHAVTISHAGVAGQDLYFDFLELAVPVTELPVLPAVPGLTLATDWDTDHSLALAPERTAWMIHSLGFHGRQNHYVGALVFYELHNPGGRYAAGTITFNGPIVVNDVVSVTVGPAAAPVVLARVVHAGDTGQTLALSFAQEINRGYTSIRASAAGDVLTIYARQLGAAGEAITLGVSGGHTASGEHLTGGQDGEWLTDLAATPRLNRAARDWTRSFFSALHGYGLDAAAAFSMELKHGDQSTQAGIAQRGPAGDPVRLPTPALQTNFSPASLGFWKEVYAGCAAIMAEAGLQPFLQFGEVQWWYFPHDGAGTPFSGMPFYDAWTTAEFQARYGHAMAIFTTADADPAAYPHEVEFLASLLGEFTSSIMAHVRATYPNARFEVLYPFDVNQTLFNQAINFPAAAWTSQTLQCLKTEGLSFTFSKRLKDSEEGIEAAAQRGFPASQRSHLVGLGDATAPWLKEMRIAWGKGLESVVGFALDQFCLIGYPVPLALHSGRGTRLRG